MKKPVATHLSWSGTDLSEPTKDVTIPKGSTGNRSYTANWPSTTEYVVEHYKQNLDGSYPGTADESETKYGSIGENTVAAAKTYEGFNAKAFSQESIVDTSGGADPTVIRIYYERKTFTITWENEDGTSLSTVTKKYGEAMPEYQGDTPTKDATAEHSYSFKEWVPDVTIGETVTGNVVFTASYTASTNKYKIMFVDEDDSLLQESDWEYGTIPTYNGTAPEKQGDAQHSYTFDKWMPDIVSVAGEAIYKATYTQTTNEYIISWKNDDGTELANVTKPYGDPMPEYQGDEPTKDATAEHTYTFDKWVPNVNVGDTVTGNIVFTASYTATTNKHMITFVDEDGEPLQSSEVEYGQTPEYKGDTPSKTEDDEYTYEFDGWEPAITAVSKEATYTAKFKAIKKPVSYYYSQGENSTWQQEDGKGASFTVKRDPAEETTFAHFTGIKVDGKNVSTDKYTAESGSVKLALKSAYIDSLATGEHKLTALFDDGQAETSFYVKAKNDPNNDDSSDGDDGTGTDADSGSDGGDGTGTDADSGSDEGADSESGEGAGSGSSGSGKNNGSAKTGDQTSIPLIAFLMLTAAATMAGIYRRRRS